MSKLRSDSTLASLTDEQRDQLYARDVCFGKLCRKIGVTLVKSNKSNRAKRYGN